MMLATKAKREMSTIEPSSFRSFFMRGENTVSPLSAQRAGRV